MPDPELPPGTTDQPSAAVVAARLQARFEGLDTPGAAPPPAGTPGLEPGRVPRSSAARSGDTAAQRQLDDLNRQLVVLRQQLDLAFDEVDERVDAAEARAAVAESRAAVAETKAAEAEALVREATAAVAALQARITGDDGGEGGATNLRSALDRLRNRLDVG